jgi:hypothetical protein
VVGSTGATAGEAEDAGADAGVDTGSATGSAAMAEDEPTVVALLPPPPQAMREKDAAIARAVSDFDVFILKDFLKRTETK